MLRDAAVDLVRRGEAHKHRENNILIADLVRAGDQHFRATLRVHNDNELLLDHQTGQHVQGMVAVEASRQMFLAVTERVPAGRLLADRIVNGEAVAVNDSLNITVCQLDARAEHRPAALAALADHVTRTRSDLVVLPELPFSDWLGTVPVADPARWQRSVDEHESGIARLNDLGAPAVIASRPTIEVTGSRRNQAFVWTAQTGAARIRDKYYLPDEPGFWEASWYDRGEPTFDTCRVGNARIGVLLCTDLWFFEWARHYARSGVELLCVPRATPTESLAKWLAGGQAAAICSGAYSVSSNQWIPSGSGLDCGGLGWIIDPDGNVLATTTADEPFVTVPIDLGLARKAKTTYPRYVRE